MTIFNKPYIYSNDIFSLICDKNKSNFNHSTLDSPSTFTLTMNDSGLEEIGVLFNDLLLVQRNIHPKHLDIVAFDLDGTIVIRRLYKDLNDYILLPHNSAILPLEIKEKDQYNILGVVQAVLRSNGVESLVLS